MLFCYSHYIRIFLLAIMDISTDNGGISKKIISTKLKSIAGSSPAAASNLNLSLTEKKGGQQRPGHDDKLSIRLFPR